MRGYAPFMEASPGTLSASSAGLLQSVIGAPDSEAVRAQVGAALQDKAQRVSSLLEQEVSAVRPSPQAAGYRARLSLRADPEGRLGQSPPRSHAVVPLTHVPLARPEINAVLKTLPPLPGLGQVELRSDGERVVLSAWTPRKGKGARNRRNRGSSGAQRRALSSLDLAAHHLAGVALDGRALAGDATTHLRVGGVEHRLAPGTFYQVNLDVNAMLVDVVGAMVRSVGATALLDLYAGAGNLSLPLVRAGLPAVLIEQAGSSTADAERTIRRLGLAAEVRTADAGRYEPGSAFFDVAILDPPRAGAPGLVKPLLLTRPRALVYVACNPAALARDLRPAREAGYRIARLEVFDMFPQTPHVEAVALVVRPDVVVADSDAVAGPGNRLS